MSTHRSRRLGALTGLIPLLALALAVFTAAAGPLQAAQEDLAEVSRLEYEGQKVDAFLLLKELAPKGDPEAQYKLGGYYQYGYAGPANFKLALEWYERAARQGHTDAMLGIAILFDPAFTQAASIEKSRAKSFTWLSIAATQLKDADEKATVAGLRDKLKSELSTAELQAALNEAMTFQPVPEPRQ